MLVRSLAATALFALLFVSVDVPASSQLANMASNDRLLNGSLTVRNAQGGALFLESKPPAGTEAIGFCAEMEVSAAIGGVWSASAACSIWSAATDRQSDEPGR